MNGLGWLGFTIAFLAPLPPERPERPHPPKRPEVQRLNERMACLLGAVAMLVAITPFFVAWGVRRTYDVYRVGCEASGGRVANVPEGGLPYRCHH